jgi:Protein of unknown function (DUF3306)
MSDSETFLARWLRLKRESEAPLPAVEAPSPVAFDPASLPPIKSIVADSNIQQFLHEGVPAELSRAALRSAWTADPAIRDFVGIAENQWNFNDHAGIPGFGPLEATDYLVAQALARLTNVAQEAPRDAEGVEQPVLPVNEPLEAVRPAPTPPVIGKTTGAAAVAGVMEAAGGETGSGAAAPRSHGGALPQ